MSQSIRYMGRIRGLIENGIYVTERRPEHFFIKYQGFGLSKKILDVLEQKRIKKMSIIYKGKKTIRYLVNLEDFRKFGIPYTDTTEEKPDEQLILNKKHMIEEVLAS